MPEKEMRPISPPDKETKKQKRPHAEIQLDDADKEILEEVHQDAAAKFGPAEPDEVYGH